MVNYRGKLDIVADILTIVSDNARKTKIMYGANLSYKVLQKYLAEVVGASLITFDASSQEYVLTPKGERFLAAYQVYSKDNESVEQYLNRVMSQKRFLEELCSTEVAKC